MPWVGAIGRSIEITATNGGAAAANDVVIRDEPPRRLRYLPETTTLDGTHQPDIDGDSPLSHGIAGFGMTIGRLDAGASVTITYAVEATEAVLDVGSLPMRATVSSREQEVPIAANAPPVVMLDELLSRIAAIPGVAAVDALGMVDLPPGALAAKGTGVGEPIRVFAFDQRYLDHYPSIRIVSGQLASSGALLSVEAARPLGVEPGSEIELAVPGRASSLRLPVTGTVDLAQAQPLFSSRKASKLEEFLYVPNVGRDLSRDVPRRGRPRLRPRAGHGRHRPRRAFRSWKPTCSSIEDHSSADPATALAQTSAVDRGDRPDRPRSGVRDRQHLQRTRCGERRCRDGQTDVPVPGASGCSARGVPGRVRCEHPGRDRAPGAGDPSRSWRRPPAPANDRAHEVTRDRVRRIDRRYRARPALDGDRPRRDHRVRGDDRRTHPAPRSCRPPSVSSSPPSRCTSPRGARSDGKSANNGGHSATRPRLCGGGTVSMSRSWSRRWSWRSPWFGAVPSIHRLGRCTPGPRSPCRRTCCRSPSSRGWAGRSCPYGSSSPSHRTCPCRRTISDGSFAVSRVGAFDVARPISLAASSGLASS